MFKSLDLPSYMNVQEILDGKEPKMNIAVWIASGLLAFVFAGAGGTKLVLSKEKLISNPSNGYAEALSPGLIKFIGAAEVAAALGLILPVALNVVPVLTPLAAVGIIALMVGAVVTHSRRNEFP